MNSTRLLAFVLAGSVVASQFVRAQEPATRLAEPVSVQQPGPVDPLAQRVREAQDPSSVIKAYADAHAAAPTNLEVQKAFVHRMAEFGLPEMADQQAQDLLARAPDDAVAWAVTGYVAAKRNQMDAAATNLVSAAQLAPDDVFVQRTGAQIVAWADSRKDKTEVTPQTLVAIGTIRNKLSGKPEFAQAYQEALDAYQRLASTAATQPATPAPAAVAPGYDSMLEPNYNPDVLSGGYGYTPAYVTPYYYPEYSYTSYTRPYWYPTSIYGSSWWWPTASSFIIVDNDCRDGFRYHHNRDFDGSRGHYRAAEIRDPHFFDRRGRFGDWTDPQRHFAMSPLDRGGRREALQQNDGRAFRGGDRDRSDGGIRTSPSLAPGRVASPVASSGRPVNGAERVTRSEPRVSSPSVPSGGFGNGPGRVTRSEPRVSSPSVPSGGFGNGPGRVTRSEPRVSSPSVPSGGFGNGPGRVTRSEPRVGSPGIISSPSARGGSSGARAMPYDRGAASFESRARPAGAAISPSPNRSGGSAGHEMSRSSGGGSRSVGGGQHR